MFRLISGLLIILLSVGMIAFGALRSLPVYEEDLAEDDFAVYEEIAELQLNDDATFSGVRRSRLTGRLITMYDRGRIGGRPACPT